MCHRLLSIDRYSFGVRRDQEEAEAGDTEVVAEVDQEEAELELDEEPALDAEISEEIDFEAEEEPAEELPEETEEAAVEEVVEVEDEPAPEELAVALPVETFEQRLFTRKEEHLAALTEAIDNNDESTRERLQAELVAITEGLSFLDQSHEQETACRNSASGALELLKDELDSSAYEEARESVLSGETQKAEEVFDTVVEKGSAHAALAAFQSGRLAECRTDFTKAMDSLEKAVELDGKNPDYLRSAALLARKLYHHTKALNWFTALEKVLDDQGGDAVDLALARRELAYTSALVGRHKEAGTLYKKSMVSLSKLRGQDDPEMAVCWLQIGKLQEALGQYDKAEDPYKKALAIMDKVEGNSVTGEILSKLAGLYMELEREQEAIPLFERLCAFKEESPNPDKATLAMAYSDLAEAYRVTGKYPESEQNYLKSLAITEDLRGKDHAAVGSVLQELAQLCERQGKKEEAEAHRERAAAIFQKVMEEQEAAGQESVDFKL
ncbi:MAG: hypothetical protein DSY50_05620 [Desulfobulbus sp.]|nr:MAG: hypothetical protein DSY50_05620 [Desulfobulbus sp.]